MAVGRIANKQTNPNAHGTRFTSSPTAPIVPTPRPGDRWFNISTGFGYVYFNDGNGNQWIQLIGM